MQSQISNIMNDLVQNPSEAMTYQVQAMSQRRWLIEADPGPIVQLELLDDGRSALIYATTARDVAVVCGNHTGQADPALG